ncbi:MAG: DNA repair protein RecN [Nitrospirae bacterium]|nr:DNA repair protein RecN [Nitrospirota bacterium]
MLRELRIRDFAIIDELTTHFAPGFNVLTGETGAGKSIIVDALGLALGERAQTDAIRTGKNETVVEAYFDLGPLPFLEKLGIPAGDGIILRRTFSAAGKSKAYINDTMVNVQTLLEAGRSLVDIHGQHEHQSLLSADTQRTMLDAFGGLLGERGEFEEAYHEVQKVRQEFSDLTSCMREQEQRTDLLRFQTGEIDAASLKAGEQEDLERERALLANAAKLSELADASYLLLHSGEGSCSEKLSAALSLLREVSRIDRGIEETLSLLESALPLIGDAALSLRSYKDRYEVDPARLEGIEDRLDLIKRLARKYGEGVAGILRYREDASRELEQLSSSDERARTLGAELHEKEARLSEMAGRLSERRKEAAKAIEKTVKEGLREMAMAKAEFTIVVRPAPLTSSGGDGVEFLFSANRGEPVKPLHRAASGGELSRVMLALKGALAAVDGVPVLIFDEVDAGIGGRTAESVGRRLGRLSKRHQVLCITHLAQIAAMADHHFIAEKVEKKEGVCVTLTELASGEREEEIARMLGGKVTDISLRHAKELLGNGAHAQGKLL